MPCGAPLAKRRRRATLPDQSITTARYRATPITKIYEALSEIQRLIISSWVLKS
jgi:alkylation response protein AidB-like acyl-CoA dehydrogenase